MTTILFIGRFQPLHNGHLSVIRDIAKHAALKIVIGSAQYKNTADNPLSGEERKEMILSVLKAENIVADIHLITDVHDNKQWVNHVLKQTGHIDSVCSGNKLVIQLFKEKGIPVTVIKEIQPLKATKIREAIRQDKSIDSQVPPVVLQYLKKIRIAERLKSVQR